MVSKLISKENDMFTLGKYSKFWVALIGALVAIGGLYFGAEPWFLIVVNLLTALGVYQVQNTRV
jgi:hypothetical protein